MIWRRLQQIAKAFAKKTLSLWHSRGTQKFRYSVLAVVLNFSIAILNVALVCAVYWLVLKVNKEEFFLFDWIPARYLFHAAISLVYIKFLWGLVRGEDRSSRKRHL